MEKLAGKRPAGKRSSTKHSYSFITKHSLFDIPWQFSFHTFEDILCLLYKIESFRHPVEFIQHVKKEVRKEILEGVSGGR